MPNHFKIEQDGKTLEVRTTRYGNLEITVLHGNGPQKNRVCVPRKLWPFLVHFIEQEQKVSGKFQYSKAHKDALN